MYSSTTSLCISCTVSFLRRVISDADYGTMGYNVCARARARCLTCTTRVRFENNRARIPYTPRVFQGSEISPEILRSWRTTRRLTAIVIRASLPPLRNSSGVYMYNWRPAGYRYEILYARIAIYGKRPRVQAWVSREFPRESGDLGVIYLRDIRYTYFAFILHKYEFDVLYYIYNYITIRW